MADGIPPMKEWLESELYRRRTLQLAGPLDDEAAARVGAALMALDAEGDEAVNLHLSSSGGSMDAAMVLIDTIDLLGVTVRATAVGSVHGPAAFVLALSPSRLATTDSSLRLEEPRVNHVGRPEDLVRAAELNEARMATLRQRLADATGRPPEEVTSWLQQSRIFTATEALEAGLIDRIATAPGVGQS